MRAAFYDAPLAENADQVGVADGRDAVRDDERRTPLSDVAQVVKYLVLGVRIDG